jgi:hypothetical protein
VPTIPAPITAMRSLSPLCFDTLGFGHAGLVRIVRSRFHACVRRRRPRVMRRCRQRAAMQVTTMTIAIADAAANSPASSMLITATDASDERVEYRKITADTVVIAFMNR